METNAPDPDTEQAAEQAAEQPEIPKLKGTVKSLTPVAGPDGKIAKYLVTFKDGSQHEAALDDPILLIQIPEEKYFIRRLSEDGKDGAVFEISPVTSDGPNKLIVTVPKLTKSGDPDPRYDVLIKAMTTQTKDFARLTLVKDHSDKDGPVFKILACGDLLEYDHSVRYDRTKQSWVEETKAAERDLVFTENLKDQCDIYGQWRIHESNVTTIRNFNDPGEFASFQTLYQRKALDEVTEITKASLEQQGLSNDQVQQALAKQKARFWEFAGNKEEKSLNQMLQGKEVHITTIGPEDNGIIYDVDLGFASQITEPVAGGNEQEIETSLFSQAINFSFQNNLRERMLSNNMRDRVFSRSAKELNSDGTIPILDPYRNDADRQLLNQEFTELTGSNLIAATMRHAGAMPNQHMDRLNGTGGAMVLLENVYRGVSNPNELSVGDFLNKAKVEAHATIESQRFEVARVVEEEAYLPGKSPKEVIKAKLSELEESQKNAAKIHPEAAKALEGAITEAENIDFGFR